jgi:hypothetical protein
MRKTALSGLVALALAVSAVGPCHCLVNVRACHRAAQEVDAHACCQKPTGVRGVADECCGDATELLLASTDVPEVAAPMLQGGHAAMAEVPARAVPVNAIDAPPPHPPDRTTVLLI